MRTVRVFRLIMPRMKQGTSTRLRSLEARPTPRHVCLRPEYLCVDTVCVDHTSLDPVQFKYLAQHTRLTVGCKKMRFFDVIPAILGNKQAAKRHITPTDGSRSLPKVVRCDADATMRVDTCPRRLCSGSPSRAGALACMPVQRLCRGLDVIPPGLQRYCNHRLFSRTRLDPA